MILSCLKTAKNSARLVTGEHVTLVVTPVHLQARNLAQKTATPIEIGATLPYGFASTDIVTALFGSQFTI